MAINYDELFQQIFDLDSQVRFVGVANSKGVMVAGEHKENVEQMLVGDEVGMAIHYAIQKAELFTNLAHKIGRERSSITEYEKVTLISIPINSQELFLVSTEPHADYLKIVDTVHSVLDFQKDN